MRRLCGWHFHVLGAASLPDFEFGPDQRGYATIRPSKGVQVAGVLYELDQACLDILDDFDGYPKIFDRIEVEVNLENGPKYKAWVYVQSPEQFGGKYIKADFLKRVIAGATENRLPKAWLKFLESFSHGASGHEGSFRKSNG